MANNSDYKVSVSVQFNAIMNDINNAVEQLKQKVQGLSSSGGQKSFFSGVASDVDAISQKLEKLRNTPITSANFNKFQAELQNINNLINTARENLEKAPKVDFTDKIAEQESKIAKLQEQRATQSGDNARKIDQQIRGHQLAISNYQKQQEQANGAVDAATLAYNNEGRAVDQLDKELQEYLATQQKAQTEKFAQTIQNQVNRYMGLAAIFRYTRRYLRDLIQTYKEFDESLVAIAAVTGQTRSEMWANIGVYNKMAQTLGTTTSEVINASKLYYQQGLTTTSVLKLTEETVKLATIAELDSADATEYLTTAMNGFKLSAEESTRVTDVWANLAAKTASDVDELAIAISKVASLAENAGMEIETASAFLNQMIETTREAPENLGTALKTIIARFQELKSSEEELSDGVDANKVEKALRSAGVALRDATGQFRDFDDVILELSSKWDSLDRNTQRYIATIAAGSRQQSRFIALVSDYEGLLRNVNYAYDSLGSADAQMAVFQEGLEASTNRLKAAWEGLYTSWSESATVLSTLIDGMASFVSTLADIGAGNSALIAIIGLLTVTIAANAATMQIRNVAAGGMAAANIKNATSAAMAAASTEYERKILEKASKTMLEYTGSAATSTLQNIELAASQALVVAAYAAALVAIGLVTYGLIKLINYENERIKKLEKEREELQQLGAQEKDRASNAAVLIDEINNAKNDEEALSEVRQKAIDQFGDQIEAINDTSLSYKELIEILRQYEREQNKAAAIDFYKGQQKEVESEYAQKLKDARRTEVQGNIFDWQHFSIRTYWVYNGEEYSSKDEMIAANQDDFSKEIKIPNSYVKFYASMLIDEAEIDKTAESLNAAIENLVKGWNSSGELEGFLDDPSKVKDVINTINDGLEKITQDFDKTTNSDFMKFLKGDFSKLTSDQLNNFSQAIKNQFGEDSLLFGEIDQKLTAYKAKIASLWEDFSGGVSQSARAQGEEWALGLQYAFIEKFKEATPEQKEAAIRWAENFQKETGEALTSLDGDELWEKYINALIEAGENGVSDKLKDAFAGLLDFSEVSFDHPTEQIKTLSDALSQLSEVAGDGLDIGSFIDLITDLATQMDVATIATLTEGMTIDATTGKVQLNEEAARALAQAKIDQARAQMEAGLAAAQEQKAIILAAMGMRQESKSAGELGATSIGLAEDASTAAKAWEILKRALTDKSYGWGQAISDLLGLSSAAQGLTSKAKELAASQITDEELTTELQKAEALINIYQAGISSLENIDLNSYISNVKKSGSGTSKANNASKEYLKTLKNLAKQLKDTAKNAEDAAKREIAAILAVLEAQKDALEERQKDLEDSRKKQSQNLELWVKAQIQILEELQDARQKAFDDEEDALELQAQAAEEAYNLQIKAIEDQIDALNDQAEAEERIFKLQKARDEYNKAQNSRTRLVLTKGAGWIFKTDQDDINNARDALRDAEREYQKSVLEDQKKQLEEQADKWKEIADGIKKSAQEIAKLNEAIEKFLNNTNGYADLDAYEAVVAAHQAGRDQINFDEDEDAEGSIAYQIKQLEDALEEIGRSFDEQLTAEAFKGILEIVQNSDDTNGLVSTTNSILTNVSDYMERFSQAAQEYSANALKIEDLEKTIEIWKDIDDNIGLTTDEIAEAEKLYEKYSAAFEKKGTDAFNETSKYYKQMLSRLDEVAKLFQKAQEAQNRVDTYEEATQGGFSTGGVVDFYGPADLHGTIAEPEVVFNARQASALFNWVKSLSGFGIPQINGVNPTPVATTTDNSRRTNDIYINELNVNSAADSLDGLIQDVRQYSMITRG